MQAFTLRVITQEQAGCFTKGPAQMDIADLAAGRAVAFAGRLFGAFDQAGVGEEVAYFLKAVDIVNLVEDHQREYLADTGH